MLPSHNTAHSGVVNQLGDGKREKENKLSEESRWLEEGGGRRECESEVRAQDRSSGYLFEIKFLFHCSMYVCSDFFSSVLVLMCSPARIPPPFTSHSKTL